MIRITYEDFFSTYNDIFKTWFLTIDRWMIIFFIAKSVFGFHIIDSLQ